MRFYNRQHRHYCGIDLHVKTMYVCILDAAGQVPRAREHGSDTRGLSLALRQAEGEPQGVGCSVLIAVATALETKRALKKNAIGFRFSGRAGASDASVSDDDRTEKICALDSGRPDSCWAANSRRRRNLGSANSVDRSHWFSCSADMLRILELMSSRIERTI